VGVSSLDGGVTMFAQFGASRVGAVFRRRTQVARPRCEQVSNPAQAILTIRGGELSHVIEHLRYLREPKEGWRFAGEIIAEGHYEAGTHRIIRLGSKPFLIVSTDRSQNGMSIQQKWEEWFDLTLADLDPAFSFTTDGSSMPFGFAVWRDFKSRLVFSATPAAERVNVTLDMHLAGQGMDLPVTYTGVYERAPGQKTFTPALCFHPA
jgi:hypothetical protein